MTEYQIARDRSLLIWFAVLAFATIIVVWVLGTPSWVKENVAREATMLKNTFGEEVSRSVLELSLRVGKVAHRNISRFLYKNSISRWGQTRAQTAMWIIVGMILRISSAVLVGFMMLPILVASVVEGFVMRARAKNAMAYVNPVRFNIGWHMMHATILLPFVFLVVPLPVHPMFFTIWWLFVAIGLHTVIKYLHYRI